MKAELIYPCNLVGYGRLLLIVAAVSVYIGNGDPAARWVFLGSLTASLLLDLLDGYLARRYDHTTTFGALLDLALDLVTHTIVWIASEWRFAVLFILLEWTAGILAAVISLRSDTTWKHRFSTRGWAPIRYYFSRHQRNLLSAYSNIAHFLFPATLFLSLTSTWIYILTAPGLIVYETVTLVMILMMISQLKRGRSYSKPGSGRWSHDRAGGR